MKKLDLEKHKFDQAIRLGVFVGLLGLAIFLETQYSALVGEVIVTLVGFAGGTIVNKPLV